MPDSVYPTSLDTFVDPVSANGDTLASVPHDLQHRKANDALLAIETKLGTGSGAAVRAGDTAGGDLVGTYPNPTLKNTGPGATGPIGDAGHTAAVTIDAEGRVTALSSVAISTSMTLISSQVLNSTTASVHFASIPQTYNHLKVIVVARSDAATAADEIGLQFNSDTTAAHYPWQELFGTNATAGASGSLSSGAGLRFGRVAGASTAAGCAGVTECIIPCYALTTFNKTVRGITQSMDSASLTSSSVADMGGMWDSTAAITDIVILGVSGGAGNFVAGSAFYLYGIT